jgi:hypothetical protein
MVGGKVRMELMVKLIEYLEEREWMSNLVALLLGPILSPIPPNLT